MPQNRESGAEGNQWGRDAAVRIMKAIGAHGLSTASNECLFNSERAVVKCAHMRTTSVGVSYKMLEHLCSVLGAFETNNGFYRVLRISAEQYAASMGATRSRGPSAGKVGIVNRDVFERHGQLIGTVRI